MAVEGESPVLGCVCIGAAGFGAGIALLFITLAMGTGAMGLAGMGLVFAVGSALCGWVGWREVQEATRFRRGMEAHRVTMLRAGFPS